MSPKYSAEIVARTAEARKLSAVLNGTPVEKTVAYAGPVQHLKVENALREVLGEEFNSTNVLEFVGIKSIAKLRRIAKGEHETKDFRSLRPLGRMIVNPSGKADGWAQGRYLAGIVAVLAAELRRNEKAAAKVEVAA